MSDGHKEAGERSESRGVGVRMVEIGVDAGQRIDNFLLKTLKNVPKSHVYRILRRGEVRVNGGRVKPTYRLCTGDRVRIPPHRPGQQPSRTFVGSGQLDAVAGAIVHEDDDFLVLDKPAGLAVHGGSGVSYGVIEALRQLRPEGHLELVHRLDRDTSGCLIVAKHRGALTGMHTLLRAGGINKCYTLITHGRWPDDLRSVQRALTRYHTANGERRVRVDATGKASRTDFQIEKAVRRASWLTAELHTGRTHQIRVHAFASGHGIVGDPKYAGEGQEARCRALGITRLCLHAETIAFEWEGRRLRFSAPRPAEFSEIWQRLTGPDQPSIATP